MAHYGQKTVATAAGSKEKRDYDEFTARWWKRLKGGIVPRTRVSSQTKRVNESIKAKASNWIQATATPVPPCRDSIAIGNKVNFKSAVEREETVDNSNSAWCG